MRILDLFNDFSIPYQTEGHKHCRPGWVNVECPFCSGNPGLHLGYDLQGDYFVCWRCGWKPVVKTISKLLGISENEAREIIKNYGGKTKRKKSLHTEKILHKKKFKVPTNLQPLQSAHKKYLLKRKFDPEYLESIWKIQATNYVSSLDGLSYAHRIFIPFFWENEMVSFQCRDITGKSTWRYLACPENREKIKHKHILYKHPNFYGDTCICVEGVTDVWRFGIDAVATMGIKYTAEQIQCLSSQYQRVFVAFDDDPQATIQAKRLISELRFRKVEAHFVKIVGDPGSMPQDQANYLVRSLLAKERSI